MSKFPVSSLTSSRHCPSRDAIIDSLLTKPDRSEDDLKRLVDLCVEMVEVGMAAFASQNDFEYAVVRSTFVGQLLNDAPKFDPTRQRGCVWVRWLARIVRMRMRANLRQFDGSFPRFRNPTVSQRDESGRKSIKTQKRPCLFSELKVREGQSDAFDSLFKKRNNGVVAYHRPTELIDFRISLKSCARTAQEWALLRKALYGVPLKPREASLLRANSALVELLRQ